MNKIGNIEDISLNGVSSQRLDQHNVRHIMARLLYKDRLSEQKNYDQMTQHQYKNSQTVQEFIRNNQTFEEERDDDRIVNGRLITIDEMPSYVALFRLKDDGTFICGGNLITIQHVLTAAHCVVDYVAGVTSISYNISAPEAIKFRFGSSFLHSGGVMIKAEAVCVHPLHSYSRELGVLYDIAVIKLKKKVTLSPKIQVAKLYPYLDDEALNSSYGKKCSLAGWGKIKGDLPYQDPGKPSEQLRQTTVNLFPFETCQSLLPANIDIATNICAYENDTDPCQGDSGGGLFCDDMLLAVISWGYGCATGRPGVYARVDNADPFIDFATAAFNPDNIRPIFLLILIPFLISSGFLLEMLTVFT